ncbi:MAG TPA: protein kinase [Gemmatimonadaceae bacterium]|nr:protein kinase [Gemmatimonadaceae bacterium]
MPDPIALSSDAELRAVVERALSANYEIDREIGRGGMGIVYRAKDRRLKRTVAVKLLPPELAYRREIKSRFLREAETAAQLNHPNVVPIYTVDEREGLVYFVMACVDGCTLAKRMADVQRFDIDEARRILREVAEALSYAHARGVVHRDIKPDNILLDGESGRAMVTDFGIARAVQDTTGSRLTATGMAIGTPAYMSPEQAAGDREIDGRSDLYSLGVVGYQMLAGELPFTASSTPAMLMKHIAERPIPVEQHRRDIPPPLAATVMTLLEKEPDQRFENAGVLLQALDGRVTVTAPRSAMATSRTAPQRTEPYSAPYTPPVPQSQGSEAALPDHWARWNAPQVQRFRRSFIPFVFVNSVIVLAAIFTGVNFVPVTVIWGIFMAFKYSKLWAAGYDWRDVFRQPRDRRLTDVASETVDEVRAVFDRDRRGKRRERRQLPAPPPSPLANPSASPPPAGANVLGAHANQVREAAQQRAEIYSLVGALPRSDQQLVHDVAPAAEALFSRIQTLARSLADLERAATPHASEQLESQIAELEAQANPLETKASEERVRKLAQLKRQRRALVDGERRRQDMSAKLESCVLALQNMRYDVLRLRAGGIASASERITVLTDRARSLAENVDAAVAGVDGLGTSSARRPSVERGSA